jgi:hypothetical protein
MGVLLGVSASLLNITLKQYQLAGVSYASEVAFQAANAGMECALYHDWNDDVDGSAPGKQGPFDVPGNYTGQTSSVTLNCMGDSHINGSGSESGDEQIFELEWSNGGETLCTEISVYKYYEESGYDGDSTGPQVYVEGDFDKICPEDSECTVIQSRGYNVACNSIGTAARVVEREYTQVY